MSKKKNADVEFVNVSNPPTTIAPIPKEEIEADAKAISKMLLESPKGAKFDTIIQSVVVSTLDLNEEFKKDIATGKGIILKSPEAFDKRGEKIYDGLQSPFFGADYNNDSEFNARYSCACGKLVGAMYDDGMTVCPECGTLVEFSETDLKKFGWVYFHEYKVLTPIYHAKLTSLLGSSDGKSYLDMIIKVKNKRIGEEHTDDEIDMINKYGCPYIGKGLTWLSEHIDDVLEWYMKKRGNKKEDKKSELYRELKEDKFKMFTKALPVYSSALRTEMPGEKECKLYKMKINTIFQAIIRCSNDIYNIIHRPRVIECGDKLPQTDQEDIDILLAKIQEHAYAIFHEEFAAIDGKHGIIQAKLIGGRHDFTSRTIIVPGGHVLGADEVCLPYLSFLFLYKNEIINEYRRVFGCGIYEANNIIMRAADSFNPDVYKIMEIVLEERRNHNLYDLVISRNPCINVGSHGGFKVAYIKPNIEDKTLTINTRVLATMNADFDGDQVNIYRILGAQIPKIIKALDPKTQLYIDGRTGYANSAMLPSKDEIAVINELFTLTDKQPLMNNGLPDTTYKIAKNYVIDKDNDSDDLSKRLAKESAEMIMLDVKKCVDLIQNMQ